MQDPNIQDRNLTLILVVLVFFILFMVGVIAKKMADQDSSQNQPFSSQDF